MLTWVVYDITENNARSRIARICKGYGLYRVQKSAFFGDMNRNQIDELALRCREVADIEKDSVYIFPMCEEDFEKVRIVGKAFNKDLMAGKVNSLFV